jgi:hypothetical protein
MNLLPPLTDQSHGVAFCVGCEISPSMSYPDILGIVTDAERRSKASQFQLEAPRSWTTRPGVLMPTSQERITASKALVHASRTSNSSDVVTTPFRATSQFAEIRTKPQDDEIVLRHSQSQEIDAFLQGVVDTLEAVRPSPISRR